MTKRIQNYSMEELLALPAVDGFIDSIAFREIIIVPTNEIHDSGFRCMKYVLINHEPEFDSVVGVIGGYSDVFHLWTLNNSEISYVNIDCLPESNCIRVMFDEEMITTHFIGSDLYVNKAKERKTQ